MSASLPGDSITGLLAIYLDLDREIAGMGLECRQCGQCCDFRRHDYRLYASHVERALVVARHGDPALTPAGCCGFLIDGRCSIHPSRPLGCRTFFCDPAHKAREQGLCHAYQRRLRALADAHGLPWHYAPFFRPTA